MKYFELIYYFLAFVPGVTINIFMFIMYFRFKNAYIGLFATTYLGTSLLVLCYLINNALINLQIYNFYVYVAFEEAISMTIISYCASRLVIKMFYDDIRPVYKIAVSVLSLAPVIIYCLYFFEKWTLAGVDELYYICFIAILIGNCILFLLKYKNINHRTFRKLGIAIVSVLSLFLILFIVQELEPKFAFDIFPLFYLFLTIKLILFAWKYFFRDNIEKIFNIENSFIERFNITKREQEIVQLIQDGYSNSGISKKLFLSEKTVANHIYNIYKKLDITSRFELICLFKK